MPPSPTPFRKYLSLALLPPLLTVTGAAVFHSFVVHAILTNVVLNGIIIATAAAGALLVLQRLVALRHEWTVFSGFAAGDDGEAQQRSVAARLLAHLARVRLAGRASPVEHAQVQEEMTDVQHVLESRQEAAQYVVGLMIALGLLGTFIGLLETLVAVGNLIGGFASADPSGDMDQALAQLIGNLKHPLTAMGTAFSASMFGLLCSLMLGLMMLSLRSFQTEFIQYARCVMDETTAAVHGGASVHVGSTDEAVWVHRLMELQSQHQALHDEVRQLGTQAVANEARQRQLVAAVTRAAQTVQTQEELAAEREKLQAERSAGQGRLLDLLGEHVQSVASGLARLQQAAESQARACSELADALTRQNLQAGQTAERIEAALATLATPGPAQGAAYDIQRASERMERELRTGLGALADMQREALRRAERSVV